MVLRSEQIKMADKRPPQNEQIDEQIPPKRWRSRSSDSHSTHSASSNDTDQSLDSSEENNNEYENDAIDDDSDDRKDDDDDYDEDACSKDPLSNLTNDQRVILYTLFLCGGSEPVGSDEDFHFIYCNFEISIDDDVSMGDMDFWKTLKELENRGLVERDKDRTVCIPRGKLHGKLHQVMRSYSVNCLLSDIDKDFFIQVASKESMAEYQEMYISSPYHLESMEDNGPITVMRLLFEIHPNMVDFFFGEENWDTILPQCSDLREIQELTPFILEWCKLRKIVDPIGWVDNCHVERIKSVYSGSLIISPNAEIEGLFQSPLKSSILCIILMSENYKACTNTLKEKDQEFQKVFPSLHHAEKDTFSDTIEEMEKRDKTVIADRKNSVIGFSSEEIRHQVMGYFVMECLRTDEDYEKYIELSSVDSLLEYARPWFYNKDENERCVYVPEEVEDTFIETLGLDATLHVMVQENAFQHKEDFWTLMGRISSIVNVPEEILEWDYDARCRYVECAKKGTQTMHRARAMIVGCAGAGKTTLLKRLQNKSLEELNDVKSTVGLEVHENIFEVLQDQDSLRALTDESNKERNELLSILDFGGQCVYYACHQVYLSRRAFYLLVIDMSKPFKERVDKKLCDQEGTMFGDWTYGEYLLFWMKSVHIYCDETAPIILVGTHLDKTTGQTTDTFFNSVLEHLRFNKNLKAHLDRKRCFLLGFQSKDGQVLDNISELKNCIVSIAKEEKWKETIPVDWALSEITLKDLRRQNKQIISKADFQRECFRNIKEKYAQVPDILKLFHEIGITLYFNESDLSAIVIIDIQWFVDGFKNIITDLNHVMDIVDNYDDWQNFYQNGYLTDDLLESIWSSKDFSVGDSKRKILQYMQRLGLLVVGDEKHNIHYIPCMNKRTFDAAHEEKFKRYQSKTSVLVFRFPFLPCFIFFRLIVACITRTNGEWRVLNDQGLCLFKDVACFAYKQHNVALAVNPSSIQLQVFKPDNTVVKKEVTLVVRDTIERLLNELTRSFHKEIMYTAGYQCSMNEVFREYDECFVEETKIHTKGQITCPRHALLHHHILCESDLLGYWKQDCEIYSPAATALHGDDFIMSYEEGLRKFNFKTFELLTKVGRKALQIYFDKEFPARDLANMSSRKKEVQRAFRLNDDQCAKLFPADNSNPSSEKFDATMMYQMLRNRYPSLQSPTKGWGKTPDPSDTCETDDVERIRIYRNQVGHATEATSKLEKKELEEKARDLMQAIMRLSNGMLKHEMMNALKNST